MAEANDTVTYHNVPEFPGYRVGDDGSVWSCWERFGAPGFNGSRCRVGTNWRQLKTYIRSGRYRRTVVVLQPIKCPQPVGRLVLSAFIGPCPTGMECCHANGDATDNRLSNLRWDTRKANRADAVRQGTVCGTRNGSSRLTEDQVRTLRIEYAEKRLLRKHLAVKYGISHKTLWRIATRRAWKHICS